MGESGVGRERSNEANPEDKEIRHRRAGGKSGSWGWQFEGYPLRDPVAPGLASYPAARLGSGVRRSPPSAAPPQHAGDRSPRTPPIRTRTGSSGSGGGIRERSRESCPEYVCVCRGEGALRAMPIAGLRRRGPGRDWGRIPFLVGLLSPPPGPRSLGALSPRDSRSEPSQRAPLRWGWGHSPAGDSWSAGEGVWRDPSTGIPLSSLSGLPGGPQPESRSAGTRG